MTEGVDDAAADLIMSLEDWFCQGAVTSRVGGLLSELAADPAFKNLDTAETDDALAHQRMAGFTQYAELIDYLLDHFVGNLVEDESEKNSVMGDIASIIVSLVDDDSKQHFTCVPYIAGALDQYRFFQLILDTQSMIGLVASADDA